ncbi:MAG: universal stress protein [Microlunatus sp.]|nr:universal stress protein [Microlunatus sp.]MDN5771017.1 universal stress protein [Microlunatus sp.]MDN5803504.1 universal stress protein [Microlunatus sp.]
MTVVVGYIPHKGGRGSLDLGIQLAHGLGESLLVVTVVPRQWSTPSLAKVDAEYAAFARQLGEQAEAQARKYLTATTVSVETEYRVVTGRSVSAALLAAVEECGASMLVLGSSTDGAIGRIVLGTTTDKLLHSAPVPVALSPRGFRSTAADGFCRVTCAYSDSVIAPRVVEWSVDFAARLDARARIASFGVRGSSMYPPPVGLSAEDSVLDSWLEQASASQAALRAENLIGSDVETVTATGPGWAESLSGVEWEVDELLVIGSSSVGPVARVFLGSRAAKLIRHSPVPVVVIPRRAV